MRVLSLALTLGLALPAAAQESATRLLEAARLFAIPGGESDGDAQVAQAVDRAQAVAGRWVSVMTLLDGFDGVDDAQAVAALMGELPEFCDRLAYTAEVVGQRNFTFGPESRADSGYRVLHQFVGGRSYQRSVDENALLAAFRFGPENDPPPFLYTARAYTGIVEVFLNGPDVLVMQPQLANAEIYLRCP